MAIPEFILRKMLVPGSYRYQHGQFSFLIMNSYAPGTITRLKLIADDLEIPLDQVQIQMQGQSPTPASQISLRNPARMSTNIQISISGNISTPPTKLVLYAETKEAGVIHLHVHNGSKPTRRGSRLLSLLRGPLRIGFRIDLRRSVPITLCRSGFSKDVNSHHKSVMREIQKLRLASRHTCIALKSHEETLLGPYVPFRVNPFTPSRANENSNLNTYLEFCLSTCATSILEIDANEVSAFKLIEWITQSHANLDCIGYWLIQSTTWQPWDLGQENAKIYAKKVKRFAQAIRLAHPAASIGMLCKYSLPGDGDNLNGQWNEAAFSEVGTDIDFVYWQVPFQEGVFRPAEHTDEESLNTALDYPEKLEKLIARVHDQLSAWIPNRAVLQAINITTSGQSGAKKIQNHVPSDSVDWEIIELQSFSTLMAHRNAIAFAAIGPSNRLTDDSDFHFTSSEEKETSAYEIQYVPVNPAQTSTFDTKDASPDGSSKYVNAFAVYSPDNNRLHLTLANLHPDRRLHVTLSNPEVRPSKDLELSTVHSEALLTHAGSHTLTNSRKVTLRPHSVTHFSVRMKDN